MTHAAPPFRLGFMLRIPTVVEGGDRDVRQLFADVLTLAVAAADLGFDSLWLTQHHFGAVDSSLPSPLVFHAAIAAKTRRIRLGTTVITAPLEHPIRLAEDAATLDTLSGGRVELGLGTSSDATERTAFNVTPGAIAREVAPALGWRPRTADALPIAPEALEAPEVPGGSR